MPKDTNIQNFSKLITRLLKLTGYFDAKTER